MQSLRSHRVQSCGPGLATRSPLCQILYLLQPYLLQPRPNGGYMLSPQLNQYLRPLKRNNISQSIPTATISGWKPASPPSKSHGSIRSGMRQLKFIETALEKVQAKHLFTSFILHCRSQEMRAPPPCVLASPFDCYKIKGHHRVHDQSILRPRNL